MPRGEAHSSDAGVCGREPGLAAEPSADSGCTRPLREASAKPPGCPLARRLRMTRPRTTRPTARAVATAPAEMPAMALADRPAEARPADAAAEAAEAELPAAGCAELPAATLSAAAAEPCELTKSAAVVSTPPLTERASAAPVTPTLTPVGAATQGPVVTQAVPGPPALASTRIQVARVAGTLPATANSM